MGKTRKTGGNNLRNINTSLFQNTPKNALIYPGVPNIFNEKREVSFINTPKVHPLYQNALTGNPGAWESMAKKRDTRRFKTVNLELNYYRKRGKEDGMSNAEIENQILKNVRNEWHNREKGRRRTAVRRGNLTGLTNKNILEAQRNITTRNANQKYALNYGKFVASLPNTIYNNKPSKIPNGPTIPKTPKNIRNAIKSMIPANITGNARAYFNKKINKEYKNF